MIRREGECPDMQYGSIRVRLEYDGRRNETTVSIREGRGGKLLAMNGCCGPMAKSYYDKLDTYFFGHGDRQVGS